MKFDTPIAAACKRMTMLIETRYLTPELHADLRTLMHGAMAYEVIAAKTPAESSGDSGQSEALNCIGPMLDDWDGINPDDKVTVETMAPNFVMRIRQLRQAMDRT